MLADRIWLNQQGIMSSKDDEGVEEFVKAELLKTAALRVKPLRWKSTFIGYESKNYKINSANSNKYSLWFNGTKLTKEDVSLMKAQALAQIHHENEVLGNLDLGAWSEKK